MLELIRGLTFVIYKYEGGPLRFTVPFPYIDRQHVRMLVGPTDAARTVAATWVDASTIEIPAQDGLLTAPFAVTLRRFTPIDAPLVNFKPGANLPHGDLNKAVRQLLYAHQELREFSEAGGTLPGGDPGSDPAFPDINEIIDGVLRSSAMQELLRRIDLIDTNAETLLQRILHDNQLDDIARNYGDRLSSAETRVELIEEEGRTTAQQITDLFARMVTAENDIAANYTELNQAIVDERSARTQALEALHAQFEDELGEVNAALVQRITQAYADAEQAWTAADNLMIAQVGEDFAALSQQFDTRVDAVESRVGAVETMAAAQDGNIAALQTQVQLRTTEAQAQAIADTKVQAFANGQFAALQQSFNTYVNTNDNRWNATWSVKINGGQIGQQPVVAGIALSAGSGEGSSFVVMADKFAFVQPTYDPNGGLGQLKYPFVVGTVGGQTTVGIQGALLVDGSITANKLSVNSLSAVTANAGTLNGGTFKTHTLDANGNVVDPNEFRLEASSQGTWPLWIGSGAKNANNAVFWVDRSGNASFSGRVAAPNIVGNFQQAVAVNWTGALTVPSNTWTEVHRFTLPRPAIVGESHTPILSITVNNDMAFQPFYRLEWLNGSTWEQIGYFTCPFATATTVSTTTVNTFPGGTDGHSHGATANTTSNTTANLYSFSGSISSAIGPTAQDAVFRVMFMHNPNGTGNATVRSVRGFAIGLR